VIAVILRDLRWRLLLLFAMGVAFYFGEPGFHQHEAFNADAIALGPLGISASLSHFAALAMIILLSGFIAGEIREGHTRLYLSNPTTPLAYFGLRWAIAYGVAVGAAGIFLVAGQIIAWGTFMGGWSGMILPILSALVYGGLMAFASAATTRGDSAVVLVLLVLPVLFPQILSAWLDAVNPQGRVLLTTLLPPQTALDDVWNGLLLEALPWGAIGYAAVYGAFLLAVAGVILHLREWP